MTNVTVVTPVFNTQDYLHRCVKSVLEQEGVTLRHVIIDDGSTDNSAAIANYYAQQDERVIFVRTANAGQGAARNLGIRLADSEYIYFVDSDDYLGKNTLRALYGQARTHNLDICSPAVPRHYFDKPLEYIACLPCKSQFIRLDVIKSHGIFQPTVRSGQDGVFSHLVLAHCRRVGMVTDAMFHYTHAREGSTFTSYLKRHDAVPGIVSEHYNAIDEHYTKHSLWHNNALRVLSFITSETLKNRVDPHLPHLSAPQVLECFEVLCSIAKKAYSYLTPAQRQSVSPVVAAMAKLGAPQMAKVYAKEFMGKESRPSFSRSENLTKDGTVICKYADKALEPKKPVANRTVPTMPQEAPVAPAKIGNINQGSENNLLREELRALRGKIDLSINTLNNATIQLTSVINSKPSTLAHGLPDLVVSLTTLPGRLHIVHSAIESILAQSILPHRLILWIADDVGQDAIPPQLTVLEKRGLEIRRVPDVGPHTKLVYALREFWNKAIVTVDDDVIYPTNMLQCLWEQHVRFPHAVICNWARELAFSAEGVVKGVREGKLLTPPLIEQKIEQVDKYVGVPSLLAFPYGTSGILYPPGSLSEKVFDIATFKKLCPKEDDIWFKAMSLLKGTPVVPTNLGINPQHHCLTGSQHVALRHDNHAMALNEKQMIAVFKHFDLYRYLRRELAAKKSHERQSA